MAYDELLADRIRLVLKDRNVRFNELKMMGGLAFMVDEKMCVGIVRNELMARVGLENYESAMMKDGAKEMTFTGRSMKGYVFVEPTGYDMDQDLEYFIDLCLAHNPFAKKSKSKKKS